MKRENSARRAESSSRRRLVLAAIAIAIAVSAALPCRAEIQNDQIGFNPNHIFEGSPDGENIDVLSGNLSLTIPLGPRYRLSETFSYGVTLYYNSKIWEHECGDYLASEVCEGRLVGSHQFGQGFDLHFGQVYRKPWDKSWVWRYKSPDGAEHFVCDQFDYTPPAPPAEAEQVCTTGFTIDGTNIRARRLSWNGGWEVWPGDGTRIVLDRSSGAEAGSGYTTKNGGAYSYYWATRIESVHNPANVYVQVAYGAYPNEIDYLLDSSGRRIEFTHEPNGYYVTIAFPAFASNESSAPGTQSVYNLNLSTRSFEDPVLQSTRSLTRRTLNSIEFPGLSGSETYAFCYQRTSCPEQSSSPTTEPVFGYLLGRTLPTGGRYIYYYGHYSASKNRPYHSELRFKYAKPDPASSVLHRWSWTRFSESSSDNPDIGGEQGLSWSASNPYRVRVLDPFDNVSVYYFYRTMYTSDGGSQGTCSGGVCNNNAWDGKLESIERYVGSSESTEHLVQVERPTHNWDRYAEPDPDPDPYHEDGLGKMFQFRARTTTEQSRPSCNSVARHPRVESSEVETLGGAQYPSVVKRTVYANFAAGFRAKEEREFRNGLLYRITYNDFNPTQESSSQSRYTEVRDSLGRPLSRVERYYQLGRLECEVARQTPAAPVVTLAGCTDAQVQRQAGDVLTRRTYDPTTGNLSSLLTIGGDDGLGWTSTFAYQAGGYLASRSLGLSWLATDRDVDFNTGLTIEGRDPAGTRVRYQWDSLGRLTRIEPTAPEAPTVISYPNVREARVRQDVSASDYIETIYRYDGLGRLVETSRRNIDGAYESQRTQYDILGRVVKKSEWAHENATDAERKWTITDYTLWKEPAGCTTNCSFQYPDPLGRVHGVTTPDDLTPATPTVETTYDGLTTAVTVRDIQGGTTAGATPITSTTIYERDVFGRLVRVDSPGSAADAEYAFDERDNLTTVSLIDPASPASPQLRRFTYDALGRLRSASNPENGLVEYLQYDARGNLLQFRDARSALFKNAYDAAGRLTTKAVNLGGSDLLLVTNAYDAAGAEGKLNQQTSYRLVGGQPTIVATATMTYGGANSASGCALGARGYYGLNGRLKQSGLQIAPWTATVQTDYCQDALGRPYLLAYPDPPATGRVRSLAGSSYRNGYLWELHDLGRNLQYLKNVLYGTGGVPTTIIRGNDLRDQVDYDMRLRPQAFRVLKPNSTVSRPPLSTIGNCGGTNADRPLALGPSCGGSEPPQTISLWDTGGYAYDMAGNVASIGSNQFYYDASNRLVEGRLYPQLALGEHDVAYTFDAYGNMVASGRVDNMVPGSAETRNFTIDARTNRVLSQAHAGPFGSETLPHAYDDNGNMTLDGSRGYTWDVQNRLERVSDVSQGDLGEYVYDANGYRIRSVVDGVETFFVRDASGQVLSEFRRLVGDTLSPAWDKDYIYAFGKTIAIAKNDLPKRSTRPWATSVTATGLTLRWDALDEPDLSSYKISRSYSTNGGTSWTTVPAGSVAASLTSYADTYMSTEAFVARYAVRGVDAAANEGDDSPFLVVRPQGSAPVPPTGLTATAGDGTVRLDWTAITGDDDLWGYHVERRVENGNPFAPYTRLTTSPLPDPTYTSVGMINGQAYSFRVVAVDTSGRESGPSTAITATPRDADPPSTPTGVVAEATQAANQVRIAWNGISEPDRWRYVVYESSSPGTLGIQAGLVNDTGAATFEFLANPAPGATYYYRVVAVDTSTNESAPSAAVSARPRHGSITPPTNLTASYGLDRHPSSDEWDEDAGKPNTPYASFCDTNQGDNDEIFVAVAWTASTSATSGYAVYRRAESEASFRKVMDLPIGTVSWEDTTVVEGDYRYFVVAKQSINGTVEESAAGTLAGTDSDRAVDAFEKASSVQNVKGYTSYYEYSHDYENYASRRFRVTWSRVAESKIVGYHIYRRCSWRDCGLSGPNIRTPDCESTWVRITDQPVHYDPAGGLYYYDESLGGQRGCFEYVVRAVGPDWVETDVTKVLRASTWEYLDGGSSDWSVRCSVVDQVWVPPNEVQQDSATMRAVINQVQRGTGGSEGSPATPAVQSTLEFYTRIDPQGHEELSNTRYAILRWTKNPERDLAGYIVEYAGSPEGPWGRASSHLVAWWETSYVSQGWGTSISCSQTTYPVQNPCIFLRISAVDEDGNVSAPSAPVGIGTNCAKTPAAPKNLRASDGTPVSNPCTTKLEWDSPSPSDVQPSQYFVYRKKFGNPGRHLIYYRTATQLASAGTSFSEPATDIVRSWSSCPTPTEADFNTDCPYGHGYGVTFDCDHDELSAYYVTAVGPSGGESPRSNVVFWNCERDPGYASLIRPEDLPPEVFVCSEENREFEDALAASLLEPRLEPVERAPDAQAPGSRSSPSRSAAEPAPLLTLGWTANPPWKLYDLHVDHLGSVRLETDNGGGVVSRHDYLPFGETLLTGTSFNSHEFTGHERDKATGLDYMLARYYGSGLGRFLSTDPILLGNLKLQEPQTWNRYAYVGNNPLRYLDPSGLVKFASKEAEQKYNESKDYLQQSEEGAELIEDLEALEGDQEPTLELTEGDTQYNSETNTISFNPSAGLQTAGQGGKPDSSGGTIQSPALGLAHEAGHAVQRNTKPETFTKDSKFTGGDYSRPEEKRVVKKIETPIAKQLNEPTRRSDRGPTVMVEGVTSKTPKK